MSPQQSAVPARRLARARFLSVVTALSVALTVAHAPVPATAGARSDCPRSEMVRPTRAVSDPTVTGPIGDTGVRTQ